MTLGLIFLIFLPLGIPMSLIVIPFLAGRNGAKDLPNNWHLTYILTVGGGWSIGLVVAFIALLSIALGPALRINIAEIVIFASIILFSWASFTIGVTSSKINSTSSKDRPFEKEWKEEEETAGNISEDENLRTMAITSDEEDVSSFQKVRNFLTGNDEEGGSEQTSPKKGNKKTKNKTNKTKKGKTSRVSALANKRRK